MSRMNDVHNKAMDFATLGMMAQRRGNKDKASRMFRKALDFELKALGELTEPPIEPTYSVLHRSAATLALDCGEIRLAEKLASKALAQDPPEDIADELRDVLEQVQQLRHLSRRGVGLADNDVQISIAGTKPSMRESQPIEIVGVLRFADATRENRNKIRIIDVESESYEIDVPEGWMNDIVRPLWGLDVVVKGMRTGTKIELQEIEPR